MTFLRAKDPEDNLCLVDTKDLGPIILMKYDDREPQYAIRAWVREEDHWVTFGEFETEAAALSKFGQIERAANGNC